jgi:hypothetical protein
MQAHLFIFSHSFFLFVKGPEAGAGHVAGGTTILGKTEKVLASRPK